MLIGINENQLREMVSYVCQGNHYSIKILTILLNSNYIKQIENRPVCMFILEELKKYFKNTTSDLPGYFYCLLGLLKEFLDESGKNYLWEQQLCCLHVSAWENQLKELKFEIDKLNRIKSPDNNILDKIRAVKQDIHVSLEKIRTYFRPLLDVILTNGGYANENVQEKMRFYQKVYFFELVEEVRNFFNLCYEVTRHIDNKSLDNDIYRLKFCWDQPLTKIPLEENESLSFKFDNYHKRIIASKKEDLPSLESEWLLISTKELLINQIKFAENEIDFKDVIHRAEKIIRAACKGGLHDIFYDWIETLYRAGEHNINVSAHFIKLWSPFLQFTENNLDFIPCDYGNAHRNLLVAARDRFRKIWVEENWQKAQEGLNKDLLLLLETILRHVQQLLGAPPSPFFCYALGSLSRSDALTHSDFEGMLIWQDTLTSNQQKLWFQIFANLFGCMLANLHEGNLNESSLSLSDTISGFHADVDATFCRGLPLDGCYDFRYCGSIEEILNNIPQDCDDPGRVFSLFNGRSFYESEDNTALTSCFKKFKERCFQYFQKKIYINEHEISVHRHYALLLLNRDLNKTFGVRFDNNWPLYTSPSSFDLKMLSSFLHYTLGRIGLYHGICSLIVNEKFNFDALLGKLIAKNIIAPQCRKIMLSCMEYLLQLRQTAIDFYGGQSKPELVVRHDAHSNDKNFQLNEIQTLKLEWIEFSVIRPLYEFVKIFNEKPEISITLKLDGHIELQDLSCFNAVSFQCFSDFEIDIKMKLIQKSELAKEDKNWRLYLNYQHWLIGYFVFSDQKSKISEIIKKVLYQDPISIEEKVRWVLRIRKINKIVISSEDIALVEDYSNLFIQKRNSYEGCSILRKEIVKVLKEDVLHVIAQQSNRGWMTSFGFLLPLSVSEATDRLKEAIEAKNRQAIATLIRVLNSHQCLETILEEWQRPANYPVNNLADFISTAMTATEREMEMAQIFKRILGPADDIIEIMTTTMEQVSLHVRKKEEEENLNEEEKELNTFYKQLHKYLFCLRPPYYYIIVSLEKRVSWREALILVVTEEITSNHEVFIQLNNVIHELKQHAQHLLKLNQPVIEVGVRYLYNYYSEFIKLLINQKPFERLKQLHPYVQVYVENQDYFCLPLMNVYSLLGQNSRGIAESRIPGAKNRVISKYGLHWKSGVELYSGMEGLAYQWYKLFASSNCGALATPNRLVTFRGIWEETPQGYCKIPAVSQPSHNVTVIQVSHSVKGITLAAMIFLITKFNEWYTLGGLEILENWLNVISAWGEKKENMSEHKDWSYIYQQWVVQNISDSLCILKQLNRTITTNDFLIQQGGRALFDFITQYASLLTLSTSLVQYVQDIIEFAMVCGESLSLLFGTIEENKFDSIIKTILGNFAESWDKKQLIYLVLANLIVQPTDGKANNYQVSIFRGEKQKLLLSIVGIDNDDILNEEIGINKKGGFVLNHRCILYFLNPIMDAVLTEEIIDDLQQRVNGQKMILNILAEALSRQQKWLKTNSRGLITEDQYSEGASKWPIALSLNRCLDWKNRIASLLKMLKPGQHVRVVFQNFNPQLYRIYKENFDSICRQSQSKFHDFLFPGNSLPEIPRSLMIKPDFYPVNYTAQSTSLNIVIQHLLSSWLHGGNHVNEKVVSEWLTEEQIIALTEHNVNLLPYIDLLSNDKWARKAARLLMPNALNQLLEVKRINSTDDHDHSFFHLVCMNYANNSVQAYLALQVLIRMYKAYLTMRYQVDIPKALILLNRGNQSGRTPLFFLTQAVQDRSFNYYHQFFLEQTLKIAVTLGFDINAENANFRPLFIIQIEVGLNELEKSGRLTQEQRYLIIQLFHHGAFSCVLDKEDMENAYQFFYVQCASDKELKKLADRYAWQQRDFGWYVAEKLNLQSIGNIGLVSCKTQKRYYLTQGAQDTILDKNNEIKEVAGKRVAVHGGWFFKPNPELLINIEAVPALIKLILNSTESMVRNEIFKVENANKPYLVEVSAAAPSVYGNNLDDVLCVLENPNHPDYSLVRAYWGRLDIRHTWKLILVSMLILFEDASAKNFILVQANDSTSLNQKTQLVMIDYQRAFLPPVSREKENGPSILLTKSVLFCLDLLPQPIPEEARQVFNKTLEEWSNLFSIWLNELEKIIQNYQSYKFVEELKIIEKDFKDLCATPLRAGSISSMLHRAYRMYQAFQNDKGGQLTGIQLLKNVLPEISHIIESLHVELTLSTARKRLQAMYGNENTCTTVQTRQLTALMQKPTKKLFSLLSTNSYNFHILEARQELEKSKKEEALIEKAFLDYESQKNIDKLFSELKVFYGEKTADLFMHEMSKLKIWSRMNVNQQKKFLNYISDKVLSRVHLVDCYAVDDNFLTKIVKNSPQLCSIEINFSNETINQIIHLTEEGLKKSFHTPTKQKEDSNIPNQIVMKRLAFTGAGFIHLRFNNIMPLRFLYIQTLILNACQKLVTIWLEALHLKYLSLQNCPLLNSLFLYTPQLYYLNLLGSLQTKLKNNLVNLKANVSQLKELKIEDDHPNIVAAQWRKFFPHLLFDKPFSSSEYNAPSHPLELLDLMVQGQKISAVQWRKFFPHLLFLYNEPLNPVELMYLANQAQKGDDKYHKIMIWFEVIKHGNKKVAQWLVQQSPELLLQRDIEGGTPLQIAVHQGELEIAQWLVQQSPELLLQKDNKGVTPLHVAAQEGKLEMAQWLVQQSPELLCQKLNDGRSCLHIAVGMGNWQITQWLVQQSPELLLQKDKDGWSSLHFAARKGRLKIAQWLLQQSPELLLQKDNNGVTPLHVAAEEGKLEMAQWLAQELSDLLLHKTDHGRTSLHFASRAGNLEIVQWLVQQSPELLLQKDNTGATPLHVAAEEGKLEMAQWLVQQSPELLLQKDKDGWTSLHVAVVQGKLEIAQWLVQQSPELLLQKDKDGGWTSLHFAARAGNLEIVQWLVQQSSKLLLQKDIEGFTPLAYAVKQNQYPSAYYLQTLGAKVDVKLATYILNHGAIYFQYRNEPADLMYAVLKKGNCFIQTHFQFNFAIVAKKIRQLLNMLQIRRVCHFALWHTSILLSPQIEKMKEGEEPKILPFSKNSHVLWVVAAQKETKKISFIIQTAQELGDTKLGMEGNKHFSGADIPRFILDANPIAFFRIKARTPLSQTELLIQQNLVSSFRCSQSKSDCERNSIAI